VGRRAQGTSNLCSTSYPYKSPEIPSYLGGLCCLLQVTNIPHLCNQGVLTDSKGSLLILIFMRRKLKLKPFFFPTTVWNRIASWLLEKKSPCQITGKAAPVNCNAGLPLHLTVYISSIFVLSDWSRFSTTIIGQP
jgi:hypothetical protein